MVGPDVEARGQVRHAGRLFVANARLRVPLVADVGTGPNGERAH